MLKVEFVICEIAYELGLLKEFLEESIINIKNVITCLVDIGFHLIPYIIVITWIWVGILFHV